jgi:hypothetical protein
MQDVDTLFPDNPNPAPSPQDVDSLFPADQEGGPKPSALHEMVMRQKNPLSAIASTLGAFGPAYREAYGNEPIGLKPEDEAALKKAGVFNDYEQGPGSWYKAADEFFIRGIAGGFEQLYRIGRGAIGGTVVMIEQGGQDVLGLPGAGEVAQGIMESMPTGPVAHAGAPHFPAEPILGTLFHPVIPPTPVPPDIALARHLHVIGEGEAGWKGTVQVPPDPPEVAQTMAMIRQMQDQSKVIPANDAHSMARQLNLPLFGEYDALKERQETFRGWIAEIEADPQPSPQQEAVRSELEGNVKEIDARLETLAPQVAQTYREVQRIAPNLFAHAEDTHAAPGPQPIEPAGPSAETRTAETETVAEGQPQGEGAVSPQRTTSMAGEAPPRPIDTTHDVVSGANSAKDPNGPVYIDRRIPQFSPLLKDRNGNPVDLHRYLAIHEVKEAEAMRAGMSYDEAHPVATAAERAAVEADGVDWNAYTKEIDGYLSSIEHETPTNSPPDTHVDPQQAIGHHRSENKTAKPAVISTPEMLAGIASDVSRKLVNAGRPQEEADAAGEIIAAHYEARAQRFRGAKGSARDLYAAEAPKIIGEGQKFREAEANKGRGAHAPGAEPRRAGGGPAAKPAEERSVFEELAARGGLKPTPELRDLFGGGNGNRLVPGFGPLLRTGGMTLDQAVEALKESGHMFDVADLQGTEAKVGHRDLLDLIENEARGHKQYAREFQPAQTLDRDEQEHRLAQVLDDHLSAVGIDAASVPATTYERALEIMAREGIADPDVAYERAVTEEEYAQKGVEDLFAEREAKGQTTLPGTERIGQGELAQRRADQPLKPKVEQKPMEEGLFSDQAKQKELFQKESAPPFYSAVQRAVESAKQEKASPQQWLATIRNTPGVKPEELDWLGLEDWLKDQKGLVSKQQLADYVRANQVDVQEVMHGSGFRQSDENLLAQLENRDPESIREDSLPPTRYGQYTLPGGQNYRELLLTLPRRGAAEDISAAVERELARRRAMGFVGRDLDPDTITQQMRSAGLTLDDRDYHSSHWDEPNVLAHVRFDDRMINGEKTLHIAEVQSDWHQAGRKRGYNDGDTPLQTALRAERDRLATRVAEIQNASTGRLADDPEYIAAMDRITLINRDLNEPYGDNRVPDAPFKTTWPELALKRMIRYAAENGYDRISWDTGATNADRYDLSKQISKVEFQKAGLSGFTPRDEVAEQTAGRLRAFNHDGREVINRYIDAKDLPEYIGKDAADKLLAQQGRYDNHGVATVTHALSGLDLRVGGEGMHGFYDKILPAAANKLVKKYGAKVGQSELGTTVREGSTGRMQDELNEMIEQAGETPTTEKKAAKVPVHTFEITPQLRDVATDQGFPLFQVKRGKIRLRNDGSSTITLFKDADASTFLHESGHQWLEELMRDAAEDNAPDDLKADAKTVLDWLGVDKAESIKVREHEKFARGFETYIMEGRAPTQALANVFAKFRAWLIRIYQTVQRLKSPINDDVRRVFARLVAANPEEVVVTPEMPAAQGFADVHEADIINTKPQDAHAGAVTIQGERDRVSPRKPELHNDLQAARRSAAGEGAGGGPEGSADASGVGAAPESEPGGPGAHPQPGEISAGGGEAPGEGAGAPKEARAEPVSATEPLPKADTTFIDKAGNIRLDNLTTTEDVSAVIREAAERNDEFMADRRGKVSDQQVEDLADALGMGLDQLNRRKVGQAFNAEQIMAARKLLIQSAQDVRELAAKAVDGTDEDVLAYAQAQARHAMIQGHVAGITAEAGRALRAFRNLNGFKEAQALAGEGARQPLLEVNGKTLFQMRQQAAKVAALKTTQQVSVFTRNAERSGLFDWIQSVFINALISGPLTHAGYTAAGEMYGLFRATGDATGAALVGALRKAIGFGGADYARIGEVPAQLYGMSRGARTGLSAAWDALKSSEVHLPQEVRRFAAANQINVAPLAHRTIPGLAGTILESPGRLVAALHSFNWTTFYSQSIAGQAFRIAAKEARVGQDFANRVAQLTQAPTDSMIKEGIMDANGGALMAKPKYDSLMGSVSRLTNWGKKLPDIPLGPNTSFPLGTLRPLKYIDPFVQIAGNVMNVAFLKGTPLELFRQEVRDDLMGKNGGVAFDRTAGRILAGTTLGIAGMGLAAEGLINPSGPDDPKEARFWRRIHGLPHGVRIGDSSYDLLRLGPLGMRLSIAADLWHAIHAGASGEDVGKAASDLVHAFSQNIVDESFMRGPADLMRAIDEHDRYGPAWVRNFVSSAVPFSVGLSQMDRELFDPYTREARTTMDAIKAKVPFLSSTLMPKRDIWGEPISNRGWFLTYSDKVLDDPVDRAFDELGFYPSLPQRRIRGVPLTDQQYDDYARIAGRTAKLKLNAIVNMPGFNLMPAEMRHKLMSAAIETSRKTAQDFVIAHSIGAANDIMAQAINAKKAKWADTVH